MSNYRVIIRGVQAGQSADQVALALARYSKKTPERLRSLLLSGRAVLAKRTQESQAAMRYKQMLEKMGCRCNIEAEITEPANAAANNGTTTSLTGFTTSSPGATPAARDFQYRKAPIRIRLREMMRLSRLKALIGIAFVVAVFYYYGWVNGFFR